MWGYQNRLKKDLSHWRARRDGSTPMLSVRSGADIAQRGRGIGLPGALAILAAVLIGFAVMSSSRPIGRTCRARPSRSSDRIALVELSASGEQCSGAVSMRSGMRPCCSAAQFSARA